MALDAGLTPGGLDEVQPDRAAAGRDVVLGLLHRRQWVAGPRPVLEWPSVRIGGPHLSLHVSHHPELTCRQVHTPAGTWTLLGDPVQTDSEAGRLLSELARVDPRDPDATTRSWAGRWLLVDPHGRVHLDAAGLLACVHRREHVRTWASSSPALLAHLPGLPELPAVARAFVHSGANYHASPGAGFDGLDRLLPSQVLDLSTGQVAARRLMPPGDPRTVADVAEEVCARLGTGIGQLAASASTVWLALTAGVDSRTLLAAARVHGVEVRTFTQLHDDMSLADRVLPPQLAAAAGVPHVFVAAAALRRDRLALYDEHTAHAAQDRDRDFYPRGQWDVVQPGDVVLRANAFEVVASTWQRRVRAEEQGSAVPSTEAVLRLLKEQRSGVFAQDIDRWRLWAQAHPEPDLLWVDRLYWEQRLGSWAATTEQSLDLLAGRSVVLPSCRAVFEALNALPQPERRARHAQRALLSTYAPALAEFPINPARASFSRLARVGYAVRGGASATTRRVLHRAAARARLRPGS